MATPRLWRHAANRELVLAARVVVALVWLFEGLWLKVIEQAPNELAVVAALPVPWPPQLFLTAIGIGETALAVAVLTGWWARPLAILQLVLLVALNGLGIAFAGGTAISDPVSLVVHNLPFAVCVVLSGSPR
jgi:uncharacterized membrane protein YphA (DoxX/SURF4 family)